jgi:hypothetical protein
MVTKASPDLVTAAISAGRTGGFVAADPLGTAVLFDPPADRKRFSGKRLCRPARAVVAATGTPAWLLLAEELFAEAYLIAPGRPPMSLHWVRDCQPPSDPAEYLADRKQWDAFCRQMADGYGDAARGPALAGVRNDPVPGRPPVALSDLMRRLCRVFDLPETTVGRSLLAHDEPGVYEAVRVDARPRRGLLTRLTGGG